MIIRKKLFFEINKEQKSFYENDKRRQRINAINNGKK